MVKSVKKSTFSPGGKATEMVTVNVTWWVPGSSGGTTRWLGRGCLDGSATFPLAVNDTFDRYEATSDPASTLDGGCIVINCDPVWSPCDAYDLTGDWLPDSIVPSGHHFTTFMLRVTVTQQNQLCLVINNKHIMYLFTDNVTSLQQIYSSNFLLHSV